MYNMLGFDVVVKSLPVTHRKTHTNTHTNGIMFIIYKIYNFHPSLVRIHITCFFSDVSMYHVYKFTGYAHSFGKLKKIYWYKQK